MMVDVGGFNLHIECAGAGSPTVVLEAGGGRTSEDWEAVQREVATFTRVCSYDRAGEGKSDRRGFHGSSEVRAAELRALLAKAEVPGPYLLVGASLGGLTTQVFAHLYPNEVVGMVLVDASHPDSDRRMAKIVSAEQMAEVYQRELRAEDHTRIRAMGQLPNVPLLVLSVAKNEHVPPGWPAEAMGRLRRELQDDLPNLAPRSAQVVVDCGHHIHRERPEVVVEAIRRVIAAIGSGGLPRPAP